MDGIETIEEFYHRKLTTVPDNLRNDSAHFNVFSMEGGAVRSHGETVYNRRDFYKISIMRGRQVYHYADKSLEVDGATLMFFTPFVPYKVERPWGPVTGYFCIFREAFFSDHIRGHLTDLPMFSLGARPAYQLTPEQDNNISRIFEKMRGELASDYAFRFDLIRNCVMEIVHEALKAEPSETLYRHTDANTRITALFNDLLEQQFPIRSPAQQLVMRSASDYASRLHVHTNHLNRAVRATTGKTTTEHIAQRLLAEARALLLHTDWNIAEISYCLGFEDPAHFNHFFRKQTNTTPGSFRG